MLNKRQKSILKLLEENSELSRSEITKYLSKRKEVSRPTVIRDLNELLQKNIIQAQGSGRATTYILAQTNPLLKHIDLDDYFEQDTYDRDARRSFNNEIFKHLNSLYTENEKLQWERSLEQLANRKKKLDPTIYKRELERFIIELSWKSSQIEGNTYSLIEAESLIKQNIEARGHSKDEALMIINHKYAFDSIIKEKEQYKKLTLANVTSLHNLLTKDLVTPGIRSQQVRISGSVYVPPKKEVDLKGLLDNLIQTINKTAYAPEKALIVAAMLAYIQPFADGNKRTARMIANAILLAHDYYPLSYRNVDVNEYRKAMLVFYEQNNLLHFKRLFLEQLHFALDNYFIV